jgi:hypothetical protein
MGKLPWLSNVGYYMLYVHLLVFGVGSYIAVILSVAY